VRNIIVCGGSNYRDRKTLYRVLDRIHEDDPISKIFCGDDFGVDRIARMWCRKNSVEIHQVQSTDLAVFAAAYTVKNSRIIKAALDEGLSAVVAFPGDRAVDDMIAQAREMDIPTVTIPQYH